MTAQLHFLEAVNRELDYFRAEYDLTYVEAIGALTHIAHRLSTEVDEEDEDNEEEES